MNIYTIRIVTTLC